MAGVEAESEENEEGRESEEIKKVNCLVAKDLVCAL